MTWSSPYTLCIFFHRKGLDFGDSHESKQSIAFYFCLFLVFPLVWEWWISLLSRLNVFLVALIKWWWELPSKKSKVAEGRKKQEKPSQESTTMNSKMKRKGKKCFWMKMHFAVLPKLACEMSVLAGWRRFGQSAKQGSLCTIFRENEGTFGSDLKFSQ